MLYSPRPITAYYDGWAGPGSAFRDTPAFWNLAWLLLPNVEGNPKVWLTSPIEDDIIAHTPQDLYAIVQNDYPMVAARYMLDMGPHPLKTHWGASTEGVMLERARNAEARLRDGQHKAPVIKVDFILKKRA